MVAAITGWPEPQADFWWNLYSELDVPKGIRVELIGDEIVVSPPPVPMHEYDLSRLVLQIARSSATEVDFAAHTGVATSRGLFIPDGLFAPREFFHDESRPEYSAKGVCMVVEATSSRPETDREIKRLGYAAVEVPLYLLIDRQRKETVLFSDPADGDYRASARVAFGGALDLPAPFSLTLDTSDFG